MDMDSKNEITTLHRKVVGLSVLETLERYWHDLRGDNLIPSRADVDPSQIDAALPYSFIAERVAPGVARMRVVGQKVNALIGGEARGMPLSVLMTNDARPTLAAHLEVAFNKPAIVELPLFSAKSLTRQKLTGRMLIMPLAGVHGDPTRALGAILVDGVPGRSPRQFDIPDAEHVRIDPISIHPSAMAVASRASYEKRPAQRPALRLVVNNA